MDTQRNILAFHLFNDFSGSPKVLKSVLKGLAEKGFSIRLFTSKNGILDNLHGNKNIKIKNIPYKFYGDSKIKTAIRLLYANIRYLLSILFSSNRDKPIVYVNTIMPWGAALGAKLRGMPLVYHYHENSYVKGKLYMIFTRLMENLADRIICVSQTQANNLKRKENVFIVPNALDKDFNDHVSFNPSEAYKRKNILMLSSLKGFKGINEFCTLARMMPSYRFTLVLNDSKENCLHFQRCTDCESTTNLSIFPRTSNVFRFYNNASIVLNLSDKSKFIETFGLTIIEGMAAGLPAIVPTVGGPAEIVKEGVNGFLADMENLPIIKERIEYIFSSFDIYLKLSINSLETSKGYSESTMIDDMMKILG